MATRNACGLVVVNTDIDAIVECAPYWRAILIGRTLEELCDMNPEVRIRKLKGKQTPKESELDANLGRWRPEK